MSATTSTQTPTTVRSGDASSGSSVVAKKSAAVVSAADSIANKSQKGIVVGNGGEVNGVSAMKEKKINLKVAPRCRQSNFYDSTPCFRDTYRVTIRNVKNLLF